MDDSKPRDRAAPSVRTTGALRRRGRAGTVFLVLINLLLIAAAIWWIWYSITGRGKSEPIPEPPPPPVGVGTTAPVAGTTAPAVGTTAPAVGTTAPALVPEPPPPLPPTVPEVVPPVDEVQASLLDRRRRGEGEPIELAATERMLDAIGVQLELLWYAADAYPSSAKDYGSHRGNEALYEALAAADRVDIRGLETKDTDGDGRPEIVDAWGRPIVYFSSDDYGTDQDWGGAAVTTRRSAGRGEWHALHRFQLWSVGPDEKNERGLGDDPTSWVIRD